MSRQVHYKVPFRSIDNTSYTVYISEEDYTGDPVVLTPSSAPFETEEEGGDEVTKAVHYSTGYLRIVDEDGDFLRSLDKQSPTAYFVYLRNESTGHRMWCGYLQQQAFSQPFVGGYSEVELPVISLLGFWYNKSLSAVGEGYMSIGNLFARICKEPDGTSVYNSVVMPNDDYRNSVTVQYDYFPNYGYLSEVTTPIDLQIRFNLDLFKSQVEAENYFPRSEYYGGPYSGGSYGDVLEELCTVLGWALYERGEDLYVKSLIFPDLSSICYYSVDDLEDTSTAPTPTIETADTIADFDWNSADHTENKIAPKQTVSATIEDGEIEEKIINTQNASEKIAGGFPVKQEITSLLPDFTSGYILNFRYPDPTKTSEYRPYLRSWSGDDLTVLSSFDESITKKNIDSGSLTYGGGEFLAGVIGGIFGTSLFLWKDPKIASTFEALRYTGLHYIHVGTPYYWYKPLKDTRNSLQYGSNYNSAYLSIKGDIYYGDWNKSSKFMADNSLTEDDDETRKLYISIIFETVDGTRYTISEDEETMVQLSTGSSTGNVYAVPIYKGRLRQDYTEDTDEYKIYFTSGVEMYGRFIISFRCPTWDWPCMRIENLSIDLKQIDTSYEFEYTPEISYLLNPNGNGDYSIKTKFSAENREGTLYSDVDKKPIRAVGNSAVPERSKRGIQTICERTLNRYRLLLGKPVMTLNIDVTTNVDPMDHCTIGGNSYSVLARSTNWRENNHNLTLYRYGEN